MRSYFLEAIADDALARRELEALLPGQCEPWVLWTQDHTEVVAYFNVTTGNDHEDLRGPYVIAADVSGRYQSNDEVIISVLYSLQVALGGAVIDDN